MFQNAALLRLAMSPQTLVSPALLCSRLLWSLTLLFMPCRAPLRAAALLPTSSPPRALPRGPALLSALQAPQFCAKFCFLVRKPHNAFFFLPFKQQRLIKRRTTFRGIKGVYQASQTSTITQFEAKFSK